MGNCIGYPTEEIIPKFFSNGVAYQVVKVLEKLSEFVLQTQDSSHRFGLKQTLYACD